MIPWPSFCTRGACQLCLSDRIGGAHNQGLFLRAHRAAQLATDTPAKQRCCSSVRARAAIPRGKIDAEPWQSPLVCLPRVHRGAKGEASTVVGSTADAALHPGEGASCQGLLHPWVSDLRCRLLGVPGREQDLLFD